MCKEEDEMGKIMKEERKKTVGMGNRMESDGVIQRETVIENAAKERSQIRGD